jgi:predicted RNase H-like nuclease (RuvC/YqgF family)
MKRYLILLLIPLFFACGESQEEKDLKAKVDSLTSVTGVDAQTINEYLRAFNEIQANIDQIKEKEKIISTRAGGDVELEGSDVEAINEDITSIYKLMTENKEKLSYLKNKLRKSDKKLSDFQKTITRLTEEMNQKDKDISELRTALENKNVKIAELEQNLQSISENNTSLQEQTENQNQTISEQDAALNAAYYIVGNKTELAETGVITTEGSFIGIGGVKKINESSDAFKKIDIRNNKVISLNGTSKVLLLTSHPDGSYKYNQDENGSYVSLEVLDVEKFWRVSKYLVIVIK